MKKEDGTPLYNAFVEIEALGLTVYSNLDGEADTSKIKCGIYKIKLITKGYGACVDTATTTITLRGPSGKFRYDPYNICSPGVALNRSSA